MGDFLLLFVVVLLVVVAAVCGAMLLWMPGTLELLQEDSWPYAQRRFAMRAHRALRD